MLNKLSTIEALSLDNNFFRDVLANVNDTILFVYRAWPPLELVYANNCACRHLDLSQTELFTKSLSDYTVNQYKGFFRALNGAQLADGASITFFDEHLTGANVYSPVEILMTAFYSNNELFYLAKCNVLSHKSPVIQTTSTTYLVESHPDELVIFDLQGRIKAAGNYFMNRYGSSKEETLGKTLLEVDVTYPSIEFRQRAHESILMVAKTHEEFVTEIWRDFGSGRRCFEVRHFPERNEKGEVVGVMGIKRDISERAIVSDALKYFAELGITEPDLLLSEILRYIGETLSFDHVVLQLYDQTRGELCIKTSFGLAEDFCYPFSGSLCEYRLVNGDIGALDDVASILPHDVLINKLGVKGAGCRPLRNTKGLLVGFLTVLHQEYINDGNRLPPKAELLDVIERRIIMALEEERNLAAETARQEDFRVLVENSPDYISRFNAQAQCIYINPQLQRLGFHIEDGYPQFWSDPTFGDWPEQKDFIEQVQNVINTGEDVQYIFETRMLEDGSPFFLDVKIVAELGVTGEPAGALIIGRDISERMRLESVLIEQASFDTLTGLYNRRVFSERLQQEIINAKRFERQVAVFFIDLDRFKEVNDSLGHELGDRLLIESADRIRGNLRNTDIVARFGGDEFVVLLTGFTDATILEKVAKSLVYKLEEPYQLNGSLAYVSASLGVATYPADAETASELVCCADQAMYTVKQQGRNGAKFFNSNMQIVADERLQLMNDMRLALSNGEFYTVFQPIVDAPTKKVVKAETLIRWAHPERGLIPPDKFIHLAEECGLINEIGNWVFRQALAFAACWQQQANDASLKVAVNMSPRQFTQPGAVDLWLSWLAAANLPRHSIVIEITESLLLEDKTGIQEMLARLRDAGIGLALDDFGTGYSALAYLKKFNIDYLKIDGSFIRDLASDESDCAIAETIILMASRLGMKSVAECVETQAQHDVLLGFGCDYLQGYLYSKPLKIDEFLKAQKM